MKTVADIAMMLNVSEVYIRRLCREGKIRAIKHGRDWTILDVTKEALYNYKISQREQLKAIRAKKYIKLKTKILYRKKKSTSPTAKPRPRVKYETWEDRSPSQKKWDLEEEE